MNVHKEKSKTVVCGHGGSLQLLSAGRSRFFRPTIEKNLMRHRSGRNGNSLSRRLIYTGKGSEGLRR